MLGNSDLLRFYLWCRDGAATVETDRYSWSICNPNTLKRWRPSNSYFTSSEVKLWRRRDGAALKAETCQEKQRWLGKKYDQEMEAGQVGLTF